MGAGGLRLQRPFLPLEQRVEKMTQQQAEEQEVRFKHSQTQRGRTHVSTSVDSVPSVMMGRFPVWLANINRSKQPKRRTKQTKK